MSLLRRLLVRGRGEGGYTLIELVTVMAILGVVVGALTTLFVRAMTAEVDANRRFRSQQDARVAVDRMRREIHCSSGITPTGASSSISVTLPAQCPSAGGSLTTVTYDFAGSGQRFQLRRN